MTTLINTKPWSPHLQSSLSSLSPSLSTTTVSQILRRIKTPTAALNFFSWAQSTGFSHPPPNEPIFAFHVAVVVDGDMILLCTSQPWLHNSMPPRLLCRRQSRTLTRFLALLLCCRRVPIPRLDGGGGEGEGHFKCEVAEGGFVLGGGEGGGGV